MHLSSWKKISRRSFTFKVNKIEVNKGDCITIAPGEIHWQSNPFQEDVTWLYFGIATDE